MTRCDDPRVAERIAIPTPMPLVPTRTTTLVLERFRVGIGAW